MTNRKCPLQVIILIVLMTFVDMGNEKHETIVNLIEFINEIYN
jgi:hypothetical protein